MKFFLFSNKNHKKKKIKRDPSSKYGNNDSQYRGNSNTSIDLKWKTGDRVGIYLDLEENFVFYFVNGEASPDGIAFQNLPKAKYHFYFCGVNDEASEIVDSKLYISQKSELYKELKHKMENFHQKNK